MSAPTPRGWCPGVLRPMPTGDGLLVRLQFNGRTLSPHLARGLAQAARRFGNGLIDLTSRGNLQLRGVSPATHALLVAHLGELGFLGDSKIAETKHTIIASPLAGLMQFGAVMDITPIVAKLDARLAADPFLQDRLPAKFSFVIDDGGWPSLANIDAYLRFVATRRTEGISFRVYSGGKLQDASWLGLSAPEKVVDDALRLARDMCIGPRTPDRTSGQNPSFRDYGKTLSPLIGAFGHAESRHLLGLAASFGRLSADGLSLLADASEDLGHDLRLTPWRTLFMPVVDSDRLQSWLPRLTDGGFILDPDDPRLAVAACPGAPACASATTPTQADALRLAPLARRLAKGGIGLHVSGCAKGCACRDRAPVTLVAENGRYRLVRNGKAQDPAASAPLPIAAVEAGLQSLVAAVPA